MKLHKLILAILITGVIGCQSSKNQTIIIKGKINGEIPTKSGIYRSNKWSL